MAVRIYQRGETWYYDLKVKNPVTGATERRRISTKESDRKRAQMVANRAELAAEDGTYVEPKKGGVHGAMTCFQAFDWAITKTDWMDEKAKSTETTARQSYKRMTSRGVFDDGDPIATLDSDRLLLIRRQLKNTGLSHSSINLSLWVLRKMVEEAERRGAIKSLPRIPKALSTKGNSRERIILTAEQEEMIGHMRGNPRYVDLHDYWVLMTDTGFRAMEVLTLQQPDIEFDTESVRVRPEVSKTKTERRAILHERMREVCERRIAAHGFHLFPVPAGRAEKYWYKRMCDQLKEVRRDLGKPDVTAHVLRHSFASMLVQKSSLPTAMALLGHTCPETTMGYVKAIPADVRAASIELELRKRKEREALARHSDGHSRPESQ